MNIRLQTQILKLPTQTSESSGCDSSAIYIAVGRSLEKEKVLILWTLRCFDCKEVVLVHVLKRSRTIPTLMGNVPATTASEVVVSAHRMEERKQAKRVLRFYASLCHKEKVKARILLVESEDVAGGLLHLINTHTIKRLVMGTTLNNCTKIKNGLEKASVTAKNAPAFCEIWFVKKGKHIWTKDANEDPGPGLIMYEPRATFVNDMCSNLETDNYVSPPAADITEGADRIQTEFYQPEALVNTSSNFTVMDEEGRLPNIDVKDKEENYTPQESTTLERSGDLELCQEAFEESANYIDIERETTEAVNRAISSKAAITRENKITKELKRILKHVRKERKELAKEIDEASVDLAKSMEAITVLESSALKAAQRQNEVVEELKLVQDSIVALKIERYKIHLLREAKKHLPQVESENSEESMGLSGGGFVEFSSLDLQNATCHFSESFKIGQGSYGSVYKGELQNKSVAIKRLYHQNMQSLMEFEQEMRELGKLRHPHLVALIGMCPEARCLVTDYMPNGNLHDRLFRKTKSTLRWTWQERTHTASEIASAILFLHSMVPNAIVHGGLKPENVFFDSDWTCKIGEFGIGRLMLESSLRCPSFGRMSDSAGPFSYTDPDYQTSGRLAPKSDVYSFGIIILQLLTGRPPTGLVNDVRRAMLLGKISSVLDTSAGQWPLSVATRLAEFGLQCCKDNSHDRPEMTQLVVRELQRMHIMEEQPAPHFFLCPILQEIMHDPHVAADGYTYEGNALRSWFESGHDTSPMTNLKLDNLSLTPNHALRLAIQEWLCQSYSADK